MEPNDVLGAETNNAVVKMMNAANTTNVHLKGLDNNLLFIFFIKDREAMESYASKYQQFVC